MATEAAFLVRHGDYEHDDEQLTAEGIKQSEAARDELIARELGGRVYLLSSDAPRAMQTAAIIGQGLETPVLLSPQIRRGSLHSDAVGALGEFLKQSLVIDAGIEAEPDTPFVVVCHAPLVAAFAGYKVANDVEKGRIYEIPCGAANPQYNQDFTEFILGGGLD